MCRSKPQVAQNRGHFQHFLDPFGETERGETGKAIQAKQCDPLNVEYTGQGIVEQQRDAPQLTFRFDFSKFSHEFILQPGCRDQWKQSSEKVTPTNHAEIGLTGDGLDAGERIASSVLEKFIVT